MKWAETDRETLRATLPEALVLLPIGATEQHGPHLATGTDALLATTVAERAAELAAPNAARPLLVAPPLPFGASDHHLPFGGTLSLGPETLLAVLGDLARSIATQGGRRLVVVNGHGGNTGIAHAFAGAAASRHELAVTSINYWELIDNMPGHAGEFETALVLAVRPELVRPPVARTEVPVVPDLGVHSGQFWRAIDGYTDRPELADAERGRQWLDAIVSALADRLTELARIM
jgi:creatinine amidohydrolase